MASPSDTNLTLCVPRVSSGLDPKRPALVSSPVPTTTQPNHVLIRVDRFGFSANNVTYQALGEVSHFRYFEFHSPPTTESVSPKSHGLIPVWGFGTIVWTSHPRVTVGERVYGYFAPTRYLLLPVSASDANKYSFYVSRPHLPADRRPYNQIIRCATDALYDPSPEAEDLTMLYRPLFWTSFWFEDWLSQSSYRGGAANILISSASSKTAFCLAYLIHKRFRKEGKLDFLNLVALTSTKNAAFTKGLQLYDHVLDYTSFQTSPAFSSPREGSWIYVDVAGSDDINSTIRSHFARTLPQKLLAHISLGLTNLSPSSSAGSSTAWSENTSLLQSTLSNDLSLGSGAPVTPKLPPVEQFFMPEWLALRKNQLSVTQITEMQANAWTDLMRDCRGWVGMVRVYGGPQVTKAYEDVSAYGVGPEKGLIWSLWDVDVEKAKLQWSTSKL